MKPAWSIIICSIDAGKFAQISQCYERLLAGRPYEIIGIHDARSLCEAYNRGVARARGEVLVFSHDDILIVDPGFADKIEARLQTFDLLGFAGTVLLSDAYWWASGPQHMRGVVAHAAPGQRQLSLFVYGVTQADVEPAQALDGLCMIARRSTLARQRFDEHRFDGFHLYDLDFSYSTHQLGMKVGVMTDIPILHYSAGVFGEDWRRYRRVFVEKHAATLGIDIHQPMQGPAQLKARAAEFQDLPALLAWWRKDYLRRASQAFLTSLAK